MLVVRYSKPMIMIIDTAAQSGYARLSLQRSSYFNIQDEYSEKWKLESVPCLSREMNFILWIICSELTLMIWALALWTKAYRA